MVDAMVFTRLRRKNRVSLREDQLGSFVEGHTGPSFRPVRGFKSLLSLQGKDPEVVVRKFVGWALGGSQVHKCASPLVWCPSMTAGLRCSIHLRTVMVLKDEPTLEDALDGLMNAAVYAEEHDMDRLSKEANGLYQHLGANADWDDE